MTDTLREDLLANAFEAMAVGSDAFILGQEARGQAKLVASELLPAEGDWAALEAMGFVKGEPVEGDDLFVHATIPEGWTKERTDHSMWSVIKDERGVKRASVGYKAAFYDRWARINPIHVGYEYASDLIYGDGPVAVPELWSVLTDTEQVLVRERLRNYISETNDFMSKYGENEDYAARVARAEQALEVLA